MIRKAVPKDIDTIMDIWLDTNIRTHSFVSKEYWLQNYNDVRMAILSAEVYVFDEDVIQGFIGIVENYIAGIFVKEGYQSQGIGSKFIHYMQQSKSELVLSVYEKNKRAVDFYLKNGFQITQKSHDKVTSQTEYQMIWRK